MALYGERHDCNAPCRHRDGSSRMIGFDQLLDGVRVDVEPLAGPDGQAAAVQWLAGGILVVRLDCGATVRFTADSVTIVPARRTPAVLVRGTETAVCGDGVIAGAAFRIRATCQAAVNLFDRLSEPVVLPLGGDESLRQCVTDLFDEVATARPGRCAMTETLLRRALLLLLRRCGRDAAARPAWVVALEDKRLALAIASMREHPERDYTLDELARVAGMSRSVFAAHFAEAVGHPPMEFLKRLRLSRAAELLVQTDLPVKAVAVRTGYSSRSSFTRAFFAFHGAPPRTFRMSTTTRLLRLVPAGGAADAAVRVDTRGTLASRRSRPPDHVAEAGALLELAAALGRNPANLCQRLADLALSLCRADSAGVSVLEDDVWRWCGLAGLYASHRGETLRRGASPASACFEERRSHLLSYPERSFPALAGEPRFVELLLVPFAASEQPIGVLWLGSHTSERRFDLEDERLARSLSPYVAAAWRIWTQKQAMEAAIRRTNDFVAVLAHELRHPLAAVAASTALLGRLGVDRNDTFRHALDALDRQSRHLCRLVDDLNDLSRIGHGKLTVHAQDVELATIIGDTVDAVRPRIEHRGHRLIVHVPAEPITLHADPVRIAQILVNLLDNAAKYTPDGGEIRLTADRRDAAVHVSVRDNGLGIPSDKLVTIFDPFAQITPPAGYSDGLGLGLALTDRLVTLHGGTIHASSEGPGKGSEFLVRLPVSGPPGTCSGRPDTSRARYWR